MESLLLDWGRALLRLQFTDPDDPQRLGAIRCPACGLIHGRCGDAVYPLLHLAAVTGEDRFLAAALRLADWTGHVESPDGAWTNELDPGSWKGTTVFMAIAWAEALDRHGRLIPAKVQDRWLTRLMKAGNFIASQFTPDYGNINYAASGAYGLALLGRLLAHEPFLSRGHALANQCLEFFTPCHSLLYGEGRPSALRSPKGCYPVDLGYNVGESLPALLHYARLTGNASAEMVVRRSWRAHLEFMLPDGGWDNAWGTRSYKWTYWGSRTADGCLPLLAALGKTDPVQASAARRHVGLLRSCTHDGLLHGGPHYRLQGLLPCVHHTFCNSKALAGAVHELRDCRSFDANARLPCETRRGVVELPEIDTRLVASGPWRATITGYDWLYKGNVHHATGGAMTTLWHRRLGLIAAGGLPIYTVPEPNNMQPFPPGAAAVLTPRVECADPAGRWWSNLFDLGAATCYTVSRTAVRVEVLTWVGPLSNPANGFRIRLVYEFLPKSFKMIAEPLSKAPEEWSLVFPIVSPHGEPVSADKLAQLTMFKAGGALRVKGNPACCLVTKDREFNPIGGFQAVKVIVPGEGMTPAHLELSN